VVRIKGMAQTEQISDETKTHKSRIAGGKM
jgi:hypothetical protein